MDLELDFEKRHRLVKEIIETFVLTMLMFLVIRLAVQNFNIDGHSMEPNLHDQELMIVDKWSYLIHPPARGDVIVFVAPPEPTLDYVKRVIGLPGDVISIKDTVMMINGQETDVPHITVNGKTIDEPYIDPGHEGSPPGFEPFQNRVVPADTYYVLGDNRGGSSDSRVWGCVPRANIIGRGAFIYWPLGQNNMGILPNVASAFHSVPDPSASTPAPASTCPVQHNGASSTVPSLSSLPQSTSTDTVLMLILPSAYVGLNQLPYPRKKRLRRRERAS